VPICAPHCSISCWYPCRDPEQVSCCLESRRGAFSVLEVTVSTMISDVDPCRIYEQDLEVGAPVVVGALWFKYQV